MVALAGIGIAAIAEGVRRAGSPVDQDRVIASSAVVELSQMGESLRRDVAKVVRPQIERTEKLSHDPDLIASLKQNDRALQTAACNRAVTQATEIDAFALFDRTGNIVAINNVYASGKPIAAERVRRIMGSDFDHRQIIQSCARNGSQSKVLEFQTTCDITPALFDSSGLSVAYSVPVSDPATGERLGVVSSRIRFDRLSDLIRSHAVAGEAGTAEFVTDKGGYFSEQINSGRTAPPVPVSVLSGIISPMVAGKVDALFCRNGPDYLCLVKVKDFATLKDGGIQVMLVVKGEWLAAEARQARRLECVTWVGGGLIVMAAAALLRGAQSRRDSDRWSRLLIDSAIAAVVTTDDRGCVRDWNRQAEALFGHTVAEVTGKCLSGLIVPPGRPAGPLSIRKSPDDRSPAGDQTELQLVRKDGRQITVDVSVNALRIGRHTRHCVFMYDITDYKLTQSQLVQSQKLESIGHLAAGIAHEINTPAQYVGDNVRFLKEQFAALMSVIDEFAKQIDTSRPPLSWDARREAVAKVLAEADFEFLRREIPQAVDQSIEGLDRVIAIVGAMKDFSHPGSTRKEPADLNRSITSTIEVCRNRWKFVADLSTDLDPDLPPVPCLVAEFNQVILNLVVNAADAIDEKRGPGGPGRGHIHVSTALKTTPRGQIVEIRIKDDGPGIPESVGRRLFEPFFTTKSVGKGTGQGLTISRNVVVEKHGGEIRFENNPQAGATFVIRLPVDDPAVSRLEAA